MFVVVEWVRPGIRFEAYPSASTISIANENYVSSTRSYQLKVWLTVDYVRISCSKGWVPDCSMYYLPGLYLSHRGAAWSWCF
jgi:hypothetical protein